MSTTAAKGWLHLILMTVLVFAASLAAGRDWFVRAGSNGDGSREKPFQDPYLALEEAGPGDTLHVARGVYSGRLNSANWVIAIPSLTWLGGYSDDFTQRDPWRFPSELRFASDFVGKHSGTFIKGRGSHENFVLDGFLLDQKEYNRYGKEPYASLTSRSSDPMVELSASGGQIRNCLILNGAAGGLDVSGDGFRIENNLVMNIDQAPLVRFGSHEGRPTVLHGNTFLFCWSNEGVGRGGSPKGRGVSFWSCDHEFELIDNIFLGCDGWAVDARSAEKLTLKGNIFWLNGASNVKVQARGQTVHVDNASMNDLDDAGLQACAGNVACNPELAGLDAKWMEKFLDRAAESYPNAKLEELNELRRAAGLTMLTEKRAPGRLNYAMAYDCALALKIVPAKLKQGAHPVAIEVKPFTASPAEANYQYEPKTWQQFAERPRTLEGKRVEIIGALGREDSIFGFEGINEDQYLGFQFHDVQERFGQKPIVYFRKGTKAERMLMEIQRWDGNGTPPEKHLLRGLVKYEAGAKLNRKGTVLVDSITPITEAAQVESKPRPPGRDWFVRAGASGNGSKAEPFKDPWQALEAANPGDAIHVAEGEYFGKLKSGQWTIKTPYLSLLGGYDQEFKERAPWKHPSRLGYSPGASRGGSGAYVVGEDDHSGLVFDGFVLDGRDVNRLDGSGNLASRFPERELMTLGSSNLTIRNCVLLNAGGAALLAWGDNLRIENNLILNCNYYSIEIRSTPKHPAVIRNNTILFIWHADRSRGSGSAGTAIFAHAGIRFELDNNIIGYADGQAVLAYDRKRVKILNNVFTHNRFANLTDLDQVVVNDEKMGLMGELGFAAAAGNVVLDPQMSFDEKWWTDYSREDGPAFFARPYDWRKALTLVPRNPACKAGARPVTLEVHVHQ